MNCDPHLRFSVRYQAETEEADLSNYIYFLDATEVLQVTLVNLNLFSPTLLENSILLFAQLRYFFVLEKTFQGVSKLC